MREARNVYRKINPNGGDFAEDLKEIGVENGGG
jgi:hypothetical protein